MEEAMLEIGQRFKFTDGQGKVSEYVIPSEDDAPTLGGKPVRDIEHGANEMATVVALQNVETGKCAAVYAPSLTAWPGSGEWSPA